LDSGSSWLSPADVAEAVVRVAQATGLKAWMVFGILLVVAAAWGVGRWKNRT
jgi:hypothetical protein